MENPDNVDKNKNAGITIEIDPIPGASLNTGNNRVISFDTSLNSNANGATTGNNNAGNDDDDSGVEIRKPQTERCVLEDFTVCSKSHLWKLMMSFYDRKGPESWSQGIVPHFITCNTFIGKSYAKVQHWTHVCFLSVCMMY
jgi:hypothetical protein